MRACFVRGEGDVKDAIVLFERKLFKVIKVSMLWFGRFDKI